MLWERHIADSLLLVPHIPAGVDHAIDLGSGAGFPGLVLAIETGIAFTLIESDARKAAFLLEAARVTGAKVRVLNQRIEAARPVPAPLVTARALAPLDKLLALAGPHLAPGGVALFPKGGQVAAEMAAAAKLFRMRVETCETGPLSCILKVSGWTNIGPTTPTHHRDF